MGGTRVSALSYAQDNRRRFVEQLDGFLRIPSISALPAHAGDIRRAADWLIDDLRAIGLTTELIPIEGSHPMVYAEWKGAPGRPTVLFYGHYDVQPVDPLDLWERPPFEPVVRDGRILARGAADDKGQVHMHLRAVEALLATRSRLPINLRFVFEGEEESTSIHLADWLAANRERLGADVAVISDSGFFDGNVPAITIGLRGIMYAQIDVVGSPVDLHSGTYGGAVPNPATTLARLIAELKGPDGVITIPRFYDDVRPLTDEDRAAFAALPFDEDAWAAGVGVHGLAGEAGYTTLERKGGRPTLDVNGMWAGFIGEGSKTIIPAHAHAKVSCRLVPDQDPARIFALFRDHVLRIAPPGLAVDVKLLGAGRPTLTPIDHPATRAAARALEATFGRPPLYIREGGSIPVAASFASILGLPVVLLGFTPPADNAHAPNEWMDLSNHEIGIRTIARYWDELASVGRDGLAG